MSVESQPPKKVKAQTTDLKISLLFAEKSRRVSMCVGCGGQITDQYILRVAPDLEWHASCLKCADCNQFLDETCTCFVREGKTYCKRDYVRLFGAKCAKCAQGFSKNDFVMRAKNKIYHIDCFRCVACSRQLIPGDEFALRDDGLFCKADHDVVEKASNNNNNNNNISSQNGQKCSNSTDDTKNVTFNNNNNETKNGLQPVGNEISHNNSSGSSSGSSNGSNGSRNGISGRSGRSHKSEAKTTRVRTVLNEKQLHTLRTCYNANPRPDALMKEQLVEMTSLSPRVIRVWFQNKRCKDKKRSILMKQMQQQAAEKSDLDIDREVWLTYKGVPMIASSPVRHEPPPNMQPNPVEVQQYQAPWKALSDFALQSELDQPPFQQLVNSFEGLGPDGHPHLHNGLMLHNGLVGGPHNGMVHNGMPFSLVDELHPPASVSSDNTMPETPTELSSPISQ